jgi:hypothetical protein
MTSCTQIGEQPFFQCVIGRDIHRLESDRDDANYEYQRIFIGVVAR